jgi:DNA-binding transcriptional MerR regulator
MTPGLTQKEAIPLIESLFHKKSFSIKDTGLTYRTINNWSERGLISHLRKEKGEWHRLAFPELFEVIVYKELREMGFSIKKLKNIKAYLCEGILQIEEPPLLLNRLALEIAGAILGKNRFLMTNSHGTAFSFGWSLSVAKQADSHGSSSETGLLHSSSTLVVVSMRKVLEAMKAPSMKKDSKCGVLLKELLQRGEDRDLTVKQGKNGKIKKIKIKKYKNFSTNESVNKLVNQPNQKTTFHSNNHGAQKVTIEKDIK